MKKVFSALTAFLTAAAMLTGCSSETVNDNAASDTTEATAITVTHALGTTIIPEKPERVATIAWCNHDVALALGVAPVGVSRMNFAVDETGIFPWAWEKFNELGVENPVVFEDIDGLDYEAIADTDPDVILNDLGFVVPASVEAAASADPSAFSVTVSAENADQLSRLFVPVRFR